MAVPGAAYHDPVMVHEVLEYLCPRSGTIVDATVGGGGHARAILDALASRARDLDTIPEPGHDPTGKGTRSELQDNSVMSPVGHVPRSPRVSGMTRAGYRPGD